MTAQFGPETLSAVFGVLLSLFMSYVPGVKTWFDKQPAINKRAIMAVGLFLVAGGAYGLSCADVINIVACTQAGVLTLVSSYIAALVANQSTFLITKG